MNKFTEKQIKKLEQNPNVIKCGSKLISYHKDFKLSAVKKYYEGVPPLEIFKQANFDISVIGRHTPSACMRNWRNVFKDKGEMGLKTDGRGRSRRGRPKNLSNLTKEEKIKRLDAEVAYLREENRFLAKLRKESLN